MRLGLHWASEAGGWAELRVREAVTCHQVFIVGDVMVLKYVVYNVRLEESLFGVEVEIYTH